MSGTYTTDYASQVDAAERAKASRQATRAVEVVKSLQQGEVPSTDQISYGIDRVQQKLEAHQADPQMGASGRKAIQDVAQALESTKRVVEEMQISEKMQTIVRETQMAQEKASAQLPSQVPSETKDAMERMRTYASSLGQNLQPIMKLTVTSPEFRLILAEVVQLLHYFMSSGIETAAQKAIEGIDTAANQTINKGNEKLNEASMGGMNQQFNNMNLGTSSLGTNNLGTSTLGSNLGTSNLGTSNLGTSNLGTSNLGTSNLGTNLGGAPLGSSTINSSQSSWDWGHQPSSTGLGSSGITGTNTLGTNDLGSHLGTSTLGGSNLGSSTLGGSHLGTSTLGGSHLGTSTLGGSTMGTSSLGTSTLGSSNLGVSGQQFGGQQLGGQQLGGQQLGGQQLGGQLGGQGPIQNIAQKGVAEGLRTDPQAQWHWERVRTLLQSLLSKAGSNPAFVDGINHLMALASLTMEQVRDNSLWASNQASDLKHDPSIRMHTDRALQAAKDMIESFTGDKSMDQFLYRLRNFLSRLSRDVQYRDQIQMFFQRAKQFIQTCLTQPEFVATPNFSSNVQSLTTEGREALLAYRDDPDFQAAWYEANELMSALANDELLQEWNDNMRRVMDDIFTRSSTGRLELNMNVLDQWRRTFVSGLANNLKFIGIPRTEIRDDKQDVIIDNMAIAVQPILPAQVVISAGTEQQLNMRDWEYQGSKTAIVVRITDIQLDMKDVKFAFERHSFPKMTDSGTVDVTTAGRGLSMVFAFLQLQGPDDKYPTFYAPKTRGGGTGGVEVTLSKLKVHVREDARHKTLLNMATTLFAGRIRRAAQTAIHDKLSELVVQLAEELNRFIRASY